MLNGPGATISQAWNLYKNRIGTYLGITIIPVVIPILLGLVLSGVVTLVRNFILLMALSILVGFVSFLFQIWGQLALIYAIKDRDEGIGFKESYRRAWGKLHSMIWISILTGLIVGGASMLLIIPGVIFFVWTIFALFVFAVEGERGLRALIKSREYVRGYWWPVFGRFLFILFIALVIAIIPALLSIVSQDLAELLNGLIWIFFAPLGALYLFLIFTNLKEAKKDMVFNPTSGQKSVFTFFAIFLFLAGALTGVFVVLPFYQGMIRERNEINRMMSNFPQPIIPR